MYDSASRKGKVFTISETVLDGGPVDIRSIKSIMKMDVLRCKTPDMVRKEIWTHVLAYNLLRTVMAVAASESDVGPRKISFRGPSRP